MLPTISRSIKGELKNFFIYFMPKKYRFSEAHFSQTVLNKIGSGLYLQAQNWELYLYNRVIEQVFFSFYKNVRYNNN